MWCGVRLQAVEASTITEAVRRPVAAPTPAKKISYSYSFKTVFLGDIAVGKTSIIKRYTQGQFTPEYYPTFESVAHTKTLEIPPFRIEASIWDTAGGLPPEDKASLLIGGADVVVLVYEVSRRSSFTNLTLYYDMVRRLSPAAYLHVVGNKVDLGFRQVQAEEAAKFSTGIGAPYTETSAVLGVNVERLFNKNLTECLKKRLEKIRMELQRDGDRRLYT
ncbi:MAG: Rab family GTPase [Nitrososphaerota archaeon]